MVDWLAYTPGADRTHFALTNDLGLAIAQAEVQITAGILAPLSPAAGVLQAPFWVTPHGFIDSVQGSAAISTSKVQVAPQAGSVQYQLVVTGSDLSGMVFSVGQLFGSSTTGTRELNIAAFTGASTGVPVSFLGTDGWDDGVRMYIQPLNWDSSAGKLSLFSATVGESTFAFFSIPNNGTPVTKLTLQIPNGYNSGTGDALEFAFGTVVVPEPSTAVFLGIAILAAGLSARRRNVARTSSLRS